MALIICPECGKNVSDRAETCVLCGYPLDSGTCPECGASRQKEAEQCTQCGFPFSEDEPTTMDGPVRVSRASSPSSSSPIGWYFAVFRKYAAFQGRARRKEYWWFVLFHFLAVLILSFTDGLVGTFNAESGFGLLSGIYVLAALVPGLAVAVRRLHDTDRSGWYLLLSLIPIVNLVILYFLLQDSAPGANRFGLNPKS